MFVCALHWWCSSHRCISMSWTERAIARRPSERCAFLLLWYIDGEHRQHRTRTAASQTRRMVVRRLMGGEVFSGWNTGCLCYAKAQSAALFDKHPEMSRNHRFGADGTQITVNTRISLSKQIRKIHQTYTLVYEHITEYIYIYIHYICGKGVWSSSVPVWTWATHNHRKRWAQRLGQKALRDGSSARLLGAAGLWGYIRGCHLHTSVYRLTTNNLRTGNVIKTRREWAYCPEYTCIVWTLIYFIFVLNI